MFFNSQTLRSFKLMWTEQITSQGRKFYFNTITKISQWEKPESFTSSSDKVTSSVADWQAFWTSDGRRPYWYNKKTGESTWKAPEEVRNFNGDVESNGNVEPNGNVESNGNVEPRGDCKKIDHSDLHSDLQAKNEILPSQTFNQRNSTANNITTKQSSSSFQPQLPNANRSDEAEMKSKFLQLLEKYFAQGIIPICNESSFDGKALDRLLCSCVGSIGEYCAFSENLRLSWLEEWLLNESICANRPSKAAQEGILQRFFREANIPWNCTLSQAKELFFGLHLSSSKCSNELPKGFEASWLSFSKRIFTLEFQKQSQLELEKLFDIFFVGDGDVGEYSSFQWKAFYQKYYKHIALENALIAGLNPMKLFWQHCHRVENHQLDSKKLQTVKAHERTMRMKRHKWLKIITDLFEQNPYSQWESVKEKLEISKGEDEQEAKKVYERVSSLQLEEGELESESKRCKESED